MTIRVYLILIMILCIVPQEAYVTGAKAGKSLYDQLVVRSNDSKQSLFLEVEVLKHEIQIFTEKRVSEDPLLRSQGKIDHLVGQIKYRFNIRKSFYPSNLDEKEIEAIWETEWDLLHYPAGSKLRDERTKELEETLKYWPSSGVHLVRLVGNQKEGWTVYAAAAESERAKLEKFIKDRFAAK